MAHTARYACRGMRLIARALWDTDSGVALGGGAKALTWASDGAQVLAGGLDGSVRALRVAGSGPLRSVCAPSAAPGAAVRAICTLPSLPGDDNDARFAFATTGRALRTRDACVRGAARDSISALAAGMRWLPTPWQRRPGACLRAGAPPSERHTRSGPPAMPSARDADPEMGIRLPGCRSRKPEGGASSLSHARLRRLPRLPHPPRAAGVPDIRWVHQAPSDPATLLAASLDGSLAAWQHRAAGAAGGSSVRQHGASARLGRGVRALAVLVQAPELSGPKRIGAHKDPDEAMAFVGARDGRVTLCLGGGERMWALLAHTAAVTAVAFVGGEAAEHSMCDDHAAGCSDAQAPFLAAMVHTDGSAITAWVRILGEGGVSVERVAAMAGAGDACAVALRGSPPPRLVASAGEDGAVRLHAWLDGSPLAALVGMGGPVACLAAFDGAGGAAMLAAGSANSVSVWALDGEREHCEDSMPWDAAIAHAKAGMCAAMLRRARDSAAAADATTETGALALEVAAASEVAAAAFAPYCRATDAGVAEDCSVCLLSAAEAPTVRLSCGHGGLHGACALRILALEGRCPMCRALVVGQATVPTVLRADAEAGLEALEGEAFARADAITARERSPSPVFF